MKRRVFTTEDSELADVLERQMLVLVTYNPVLDVIHVATRPDAWDTWSRPLTLKYADDDTADVEAGGGRTYGVEGRSYDPDVTVRFTRAEAERLYASGAFYEANVERIEGLSTDAEVAQSALTKLAAAIHGVDLPAEPADVTTGDLPGPASDKVE